MKKTLALVGFGMLVAPLLLWLLFRQGHEARLNPVEPNPTVAHQQTAGDSRPGFFSKPNNRSRGKERHSLQGGEPEFPNGSLLSTREHFPTPQTNTFTSKAETLTIVSKHMVNTNAFLARMRAADDTADQIEARLASLKREAGALKLGQTKNEVLKLFNEPPSHDKSNHVLNAVIYSPHPERIASGDLGTRFEVLYVVFDTNDVVAKFGFTRRLDNFWWVVNTPPNN